MAPSVVAPAGAALSWSFGDQTQADDPAPCHSYLFPGSYDVSLTACTVDGCTTRSYPGLIAVYPAQADGGPQTGGDALPDETAQGCGGGCAATGGAGWPALALLAWCWLALAGPRRVTLGVLALVGPGLLLACHGPRPLPAAYQPLERVRDDGKLAGLGDGPAALSAELRVTHFDDQQRLRGTAYALVAAPDRFRVELEGALGAGGATACDGRSLYVVDMRQRRFTHGPAQAADAGGALGLLPVALACFDLVTIMLGRVPLGAGDESALAYDDQAGQLLLSFARGATHWQARYDASAAPPAPLVELAAYADRERRRPLYTARYEQWSAPPGQPAAPALPERITLVGAQEGSRTELRLREVQLDPPLSDDLFVLACPRGYACD